MTQITKLSLLVILLTFTGIYQAKSQNSISDSISVKLLPVSDKYLLTDTITLSVLNTHSQVMYYAVSIDENIGGMWLPLIHDIFRHNRDRYKAKNIGAVLPGEEKQIPVVLLKYFDRETKPMGLCRISVEIRKEPMKEGEISLSSGFLID